MSGTKVDGQWRDDPNAEAVMKKLGLSCKVGTLRLADVNWELTKENIGRPGKPFCEDTAIEYGCSMIDGDVFPRITSVRDDLEGIVIPVGAHRGWGAHLSKFKVIPTYWVKPEYEYQLRVLSVRTNMMEGRRICKEQVLEYGVDLVRTLSLSVKDVAEMLGVVSNTLSNRVSADRIRQKAVEAGFKGDLSDTAFRQLYKISSYDRVLLAAANHIYENRLTGEEVSFFVSEIAKVRSEYNQWKAIKKMVESMPPFSKGTPVKLAVKTTFTRLLTSLDNLVDGKKRIEELQIERDSDVHCKVKKQWTEFRRRMNNVLK